MGASAEQPPVRPHFFRLERFLLEQGDQGPRLAAFLEKGRISAAARLGVPGPRLVLEALVAAHMPQVVAITPYDTLEQMRDAASKLAADDAYQAALAQWEAGATPPYIEMEDTLLAATDFCPALPAELPKRDAPRIFELRLYHSPTERQLKALHARFAGPEIAIFHRCGVHPILYSSTEIGPHKPNLVYLTPFDDLAAREKAWAAFGADPQWIKVRAESIAASGQISAVIQISLFRAASYSPLR